MAQSLNKVVDIQTTGTSYLSISGKVGKFLVGDQALEFYADRNVHGPAFIKSEPTSRDVRSVVILKSLQTKENSSLPQKTLEKSLKLLVKS